MRKRLYQILPILVLTAVVLVFAAKVLAAKPNFGLATVNPSGGRATVVIPEHAIEVAPGVFSLGTALDHGRVVEGYAFLRYKKGFGKPTGCNNDGTCQGWEDPSCADCTGGNGGTNGSTCYGFLSKGAGWKALEPYLVNPANTKGFDEAFVAANLAANVEKWEAAAGVDILGTGSATTETLVADLQSPDDKNEVYFANVDSPGAIAVTIVWGIFRGPPSARELVEWDQVYDDYDFVWSSTGEAGKMDFENIATHELGHSVGLDDLYEDKCAEQTMYGYAAYGETKKRTLEAGDIAGVRSLYR